MLSSFPRRIGNQLCFADLRPTNAAFTETEPRINGSTDLRLELRSKMLAEVLALPDIAQNPKLYSALSTHSAIFTSLAGKIVRSLPVLKNHRMKRAPRPGPCARSFNCFANFDLCSSLTATSEPSSENSSPLAIAESDSTCCAGELAIEARVFDFSPAASFNC